VLIIDDEEVYRKSTARLIESLGYEVLSARDGVEGLAIYKENKGRVDLVLLDLIMPKMSGEETFHELHALDEEVRVLFTSGYLEFKNVNHLLEEGAVGFLPKPFDAQGLGDALQRALAAPLSSPGDL
jgi:two-component system, cell cycle sensor histidine kinase and response regulator CckA